MITPEIYDNNRRFIFNNWTDEDFEYPWNGENVLVKKGETKEFDMARAHHFTKHLVNRELSKDGQAHLQDVQEIRTPYEDKTLAEIGVGTDSPALASLKEKIKEEIKEVEAKKQKVTKEKKVDTKKEFEDIE